MAMESYSEHAASMYKLKPNDDWLRCQQGLALPALPPTTPEARQYFFSKIHDFSTIASTSGKREIDYETFSREWNQSADGKTCFYITTEVLLSAYAKTWEKTNNVQASKELISDKMESICQSHEVFAVPQTAFPTFLTGSSNSVHPHHGVAELNQMESIPPSLSTELAISHPSIQLPPKKPAEINTTIRANISRTSNNTGGTMHTSGPSISESVQHNTGEPEK